MNAVPGAGSPPPVPPSVPPLGRAAGAALRWNAAASGVTLLSQFLQVVFLARWLGPSDFGLAAAVLGVTAFLAGYSDLGFANALVQRAAVSRETWSSAWWASALAGIAAAAALAAAAPAAAGWLHLEGAAPLLAAAALALPWAGPSAVYQADLQRRLRFRALAVVDMVAALAGLAAALGWLLGHHDPMALVVGQVALALTRFVGLAFVSGAHPGRRLSWTDLRPLTGFGGWQLAERLTAHALANLDRLIIARLLGTAAAGHYAVATQIALKPAALLAPFAARTLLPLLARLRHDRARTASSYRRVLAMLSLAAAVPYALLFGLAGPLLAVVFGPGWEPAVPVLMLLAVTGYLSVPGNALGNLVMAMGRAGLSFAIACGVMVARLAGLALGARYGLEGAAAAVLVVTVLSLAVDFGLPRRWLGLSYREIAVAGGWTLPPAALAAAGMLTLPVFLPLDAPLVRLFAAGAAGAVVFVAAAALLNRAMLLATARELLEKFFDRPGSSRASQGRGGTAD